MATTNRQIKYINKDFSEFRANLINYAQTYFPTTYTDFSEESPGMMFMEMAAYVGDVLSFYLDNQFQENFLQYARQTNNLFELAYMFGYKPKVTGVAITDIDIYQIVPSVGVNYIPDFNYALYIAPNAAINTNTTSPVSFLIQDTVDFSISSSSDPTTVTVYQLSGNNPSYYLLKKTRQAISSAINTTTFTFGSPQRFNTVNINDNNIIGILDITDSDGNLWYEVPYLAQEMVYGDVKNTNINDPNNTLNGGDTPYLLKLKKVQRRFVTRFLNSTNLQLQFGAGSATDSDEEIVPNSDNVGIGLPSRISKMGVAYSPANFMFTGTYGIAPSNTTLTIRYLTGGGVNTNVSSNTLTQINGNITFLNNNLTTGIANSVISSLAVTNPNAASGGSNGDTVENIRQNSIANYNTQLRNVTSDDYLVRALSMDPKYGTISKAYIEPVKINTLSSGESKSILDLYVLTFDLNKNLAVASNSLKQNLSTYLSQYRIINDSVNIKDAFIINIGVDFEIIVYPNYNNNDVLTNCINTLQNYFNIDNWQINQPIMLRDLYILLDQINGVQTVKSITISNKSGVNNGYSQYSYNIVGATNNNIIYPSLDPSIFEVKYLNNDIRGKISPL
jgi:hypothetical protein